MTQDTLTPRNARAIGTADMMMTYTDPTIIADQLAAIKRLGLLDEAMPSIEVYNPVLASAARTGQEHFLNFDAMREESQEYRYEGSDGAGFIGHTTTWVAHLHYELQSVALISLVEELEAGVLREETVSDYSIALGHGVGAGTGYLAFNFNPSRQPKGFFDGVAGKLREMGLRKGYSIDSVVYNIPEFLWSALDQESKGRLAAEIMRVELDVVPVDFSGDKLERNMGAMLGSIFAYTRDLHSAPLEENALTYIAYDFGERFVEGRMNFTHEGFEWHEELRGLSSRRNG